MTDESRKSPLEVAVASLERILLCARGEEPDAEPIHSRVERYADQALQRLRPELQRRLAKRAPPAAPASPAPDEPPPDEPIPPTDPGTRAA